METKEDKDLKYDYIKTLYSCVDNREYMYILYRNLKNVIENSNDSKENRKKKITILDQAYTKISVLLSKDKDNKIKSDIIFDLLEEVKNGQI